MTSDEMAAATLKALEGKPCWYVNAGGAAGATFSLAIGGKTPRTVPLTNPTVSDDFRQFEGEWNLYIWCSWRLEDERGAIASSYQPEVDGAAVLKSLTGQVLGNVVLDPHSLDLCLEFDRSRLVIFCDHVLPASETDCNWELTAGARSLVAGPGSSYKVEGN